MPASEARTFLGLVGEFPSDAVAVARELFGQGLYRRGLGLLNAAVQRDPNLVEAWQEKAVFLQSIGYYASSCAPLERALAAGGPPELLISLGVALQNTGRYAEAVAVYDEFKSRVGEGEWLGVAHCNQANALVKMGQNDQAEVCFKAAIQAEPSRPSHYYNYYLLLCAQKRWTDTLEVLSTGLSHAMDDPPLRILMLAEKAWVLAEMERGEDSLAAADAALELEPGHLKARYLRGRALGLLGRLDEAREEIAGVLAVKPDNADAQRAIKMIDDALGSHRPKPWWKVW